MRGTVVNEILPGYLAKRRKPNPIESDYFIVQDEGVFTTVCKVDSTKIHKWISDVTFLKYWDKPSLTIGFGYIKLQLVLGMQTDQFTVSVSKLISEIQIEYTALTDGYKVYTVNGNGIEWKFRAVGIHHEFDLRHGNGEHLIEMRVSDVTVSRIEQFVMPGLCDVVIVC